MTEFRTMRRKRQELTETECIEILESLEKNDEFWDKCKCDNK